MSDIKYDTDCLSPIIRTRYRDLTASGRKVEPFLAVSLIPQDGASDWVAMDDLLRIAERWAERKEPIAVNND